MENTIIPLLQSQGINSLIILPSATEVTVDLILIAAVLSPLEKLFPANKNAKKQVSSLLVDIGYWFMTPLITRVITNLAIAMLLFPLFVLLNFDLSQPLLEGFGILSKQPIFLQCLEILVVIDFSDYWTHRLFHTSRLWPIHAIHHSPMQMDWLSSSRMHPLNDLITRLFQVLPVCLMGFAPRAALALIPYLFFYVVFLHSNLSWDFGPLRFVIVSPAYHRWHHASSQDAIDKNFAGFFPLWDYLFGTIYFPHALPASYGVTKNAPPESLLGQLLYPLREIKSPASERVPEL